MPTRVEFAKKIKEKYPQYKDIDDNTLVEKVLETYPQYKDTITDGLPAETGPIDKSTSNGTFSVDSNSNILGGIGNRISQAAGGVKNLASLLTENLPKPFGVPMTDPVSMGISTVKSIPNIYKGMVERGAELATPAVAALDKETDPIERMRLGVGAVGSTIPGLGDALESGTRAYAGDPEAMGESAFDVATAILPEYLPGALRAVNRAGANQAAKGSSRIAALDYERGVNPAAKQGVRGFLGEPLFKERLIGSAIGGGLGLMSGDLGAGIALGTAGAMTPGAIHAAKTSRTLARLQRGAGRTLAGAKLRAPMGDVYDERFGPANQVTPSGLATTPTAIPEELLDYDPNIARLADEPVGSPRTLPEVIEPIPLTPEEIAARRAASSELDVAAIEEPPVTTPLPEEQWKNVPEPEKVEAPLPPEEPTVLNPVTGMMEPERPLPVIGGGTGKKLLMEERNRVSRAPQQITDEAAEGIEDLINEKPGPVIKRRDLRLKKKTKEWWNNLSDDEKAALNDVDEKSLDALAEADEVKKSGGVVAEETSEGPSEIEMGPLENRARLDVERPKGTRKKLQNPRMKGSSLRQQNMNPRAMAKAKEDWPIVQKQPITETKVGESTRLEIANPDNPTKPFADMSYKIVKEVKGVPVVEVEAVNVIPHLRRLGLGTKLYKELAKKIGKPFKFTKNTENILAPEAVAKMRQKALREVGAKPSKPKSKTSEKELDKLLGKK